MTEPTTEPTTPFRLRYSALSDVGRYRKDNQDSGYAGPNLLVVADGVAGAAYGDVASTTAVHVLRSLDDPDEVEGKPADELEHTVDDAFSEVHEKLVELVDLDRELSGTSTTLVAGIFNGSRLVIGHAGDSRAYLLRNGELRQLTIDHTFVQSLIDEGRITPDEAKTHPHRNLILRAVDGVNDTKPDLVTVDLEEGDRVLLCSDGCCGALDEPLLAALLGAGTVDFAAVELVRSSLDHGSTDNVTAVVAEVVPADLEDDPEDTAAVELGPILVGAAAEQPRRAGLAARIGFFRHRHAGADETTATAAGLPPDLELLRYAPRPPRGRVWLRRVAYLLAVVLLLSIGAALGYRWTQQQYYVAPDGPFVAIHQGVPFNLPGITLHTPEQVSDIPVNGLPEYSADQVSEGISARSLEHAESIVADLRDLACAKALADAPKETDKQGNLIPPELPTYCDGTTAAGQA